MMSLDMRKGLGSRRKESRNNDRPREEPPRSSRRDDHRRLRLLGRRRLAGGSENLPALRSPRPHRRHLHRFGNSEHRPPCRSRRSGDGRRSDPADARRLSPHRGENRDARLGGTRAPPSPPVSLWENPSPKPSTSPKPTSTKLSPPPTPTKAPTANNSTPSTKEPNFKF